MNSIFPQKLISLRKKFFRCNATNKISFLSSFFTRLYFGKSQYYRVEPPLFAIFMFKQQKLYAVFSFPKGFVPYLSLCRPSFFHQISCLKYAIFTSTKFCCTAYKFNIFLICKDLFGALTSCF